MRISEKKQQLVYNAIADPLDRIRVKLYSGELTLEQAEATLFQAQKEIFRKVMKELRVATH